MWQITCQIGRPSSCQGHDEPHSTRSPSRQCRFMSQLQSRLLHQRTPLLTGCIVLSSGLASARAPGVSAWSRLQEVQLNSLAMNRFIWKWTSHYNYASSSAYHAFFIGQHGISGAKELCKTRTPPTCKFFSWLALMDRCWTSQRLQRHNL
jgi:hypothetical protein